jgi:hypothetical protein
MYTVYTAHKYSTGPYVHTVVQSHTIYDEVVNPLAPRKNTILNRNFVFDLHDIFHKCIPGIKQDLSTLYSASIAIMGHMPFTIVSISTV